jgi:putative ABC transport system ATP-binding protein
MKREQPLVSTPLPAGPQTSPAIVRMAGVRFTWPGRRSFTLATDDFTLAAGERLLIIGPSGGGKSTFLSLLAGIVTPSRGTLEVLGTDLAKLSASDRDRFRAEHMGIISRCSISFPMARWWITSFCP